MCSKVSILFPGQGVQYFGMGKSFYENFDAARRVYEEASDILHQDMKKLCFEENEDLHLTENTQPALVTTQVAIWKSLMEKGWKPSCYAGLSLGEYSAVVASGAMRFEDAVHIVKLRGRYMQEAAEPGVSVMAAVLGMEAGMVEDICSEREGKVAVTNYNCPGQTVIGGYKDDVAYISKRLEEEGALPVRTLEISVASHCMVQKEASERLGEELDKITFTDITTPYLSNVTGLPVEKKEDIRDLLVRQLYYPVRWQQSLEWMIGDGIELFYEIAANTSVKLMKRIDKQKKIYTIKVVEDIS